MQRAEKLNAFEDTPGGPTPVGGKILADEALGYKTELNKAIYEKNLPYDVREALKHVVGKIDESVETGIQQKFGPTAVKAWKDLNSRYSKYLTDWRDTSSVNPLPKILKTIREGVVQDNPGMPIDQAIAQYFKGESGQRAMNRLADYRKFGADPQIAARLQRVENVTPGEGAPRGAGGTVREKPGVPQAEPPKPQSEPFNRPAYMRNILDERLNMAGKIGQGFKLLKLVSDTIHGNLGGAGTEAEQMMMIEMVRRMLTSEKGLNYLSKEKP